MKAIFTIPILQRAVSDLLVMACPAESVAYGISLAIPPYWGMQEWRHLLSQSQWHHCHTHHCHFHAFNCCQHWPCCHFVSMSCHFSVLVGQLWEDSSAASINVLQFTFSLLLLFKCCFSTCWFKYLLSFGTRNLLSVVTSSNCSVPRIIIIWFYDSSFPFLLSFAFSSALFILLNSSTSGCWC